MRSEEEEDLVEVSLKYPGGLKVKHPYRIST